MKSKNIIVAVIVLGILAAGWIILSKISHTKRPVSAKGKAAVAGRAATPAKKTFSKNMGGLTARLLNSKGKEIYLKMRAFKEADSRSSIYAASLTSNRMQELTTGTYDIELDTTPQKIYKGISVSQGKETVADIGALGAVNVKALNYQKKDAAYPVRILSTNSNAVVASGSTNRPTELVPGTYNIEIVTTPTQSRNGVKVDSGKEVVIDMGCATGGIIVKAIDENGKEARVAVRVKTQEKGEIIASAVSNRPFEVLQGKYNIEILSNPIQTKKDVVVNAGDEIQVEFTVKAPPAPVKAVASAPAKAKK